MTREGRRRAALQEQVRDLAQAADLADGRADRAVVAEARRVCDQADRRLAFGGNAVVVALAGATGSGKSSLFNALSGTTLADPGVRRPTTNRVLGASWPDAAHPQEDLDAVLEWLDVAERHSVVGGDPALAGLVLLDLPDHDSTQLDHRLEVDRLVQVVDVFCWVVDPQKYADAALHEGYLKPLARHAANMLVVLNQSDRVPATELPRMLKDLRRLLDSEGLRDAGLVAASAATGQGLAEIRGRLSRLVTDKRAAGRRLEADVRRAADGLRRETGAEPSPAVGKQTVRALTDDLAVAAGAPTVEAAVADAWRHRGARATGWPLVSWVSSLRPDPLQRLHLDALPSIRTGRGKELAPTSAQRTSLPKLGGVSTARIDAAVRRVRDDATRGLPRGWADAVAAAAEQERRQLPDELDRAIGATELGMGSGHAWWSLVRVLQWLLIVTLVVGAGWLGLTFLLAYLQFPPLPMPRWHRLPVPTWLVVGSVGVGIVVALVSRLFVEWGARVKAAAAARAIRRQIDDVCRRAIVAPVEAELDRREQVRALLERIG